MTTTLVLRHTYERGRAFDVSGHRNHGRIVAATAGQGEWAGSLRFDGGPSRVDVAASPTLSGLRELRIKVQFMVASQTRRRHNLVEGHVSFALVVGADRGIGAGIVDVHGNWKGINSPPDTVVPGTRHEVEFHHDGVSRAQLFVDRQMVAEGFDLLGPIRDLGAYGLAIGHWPDPDDRYTLDGYIDDVAIWRDDPAEDTRSSLDTCCIDRPLLDDVMHHVAGRGWGAGELGALVTSMLDLGTEIDQAARGDDPIRTRETTDLTQAAWAAFGARDPAAFADAFGDVQAYLQANLPAGQLEAFGARAFEQVRSSPLTELIWDPGGDTPNVAWLGRLTKGLCLDGLVPGGLDDGGAADPRPATAGDPDTDRPMVAEPPEPADLDVPDDPDDPDEQGDPR